MAECTKSPRGWHCTRLACHEGACDVVVDIADAKRAERRPAESPDVSYAVSRAAMIILGHNISLLAPKSWDPTTTILWGKAVDKAEQILGPYIAQPFGTKPISATPDGLEDEIAEVISDSIDMDWTSSIGARAVMKLLRDRRMVE